MAKADDTEFNEEQLKEFSHDELIEIFLDLQDRNKKLQEDFTDLTNDHERLRKNKKRGGGKDTDRALEIADLETTNEELNEKLGKKQTELTLAQEKLADAKARVDQLAADKLEVDAKVKLQTQRIDELEREILDAATKRDKAETQSKQYSKQKSDTVKETKRLYEENERLIEENKDLLARLKEAGEDQVVHEELIAKLAEDKEELEVNLEGAEHKKEEAENQLIEVQQQLEETRDKLQVAMEADGEWENQMEELQREFKFKLDRLTGDLSVSKSEIQSLKHQNSVLKDSTLIGEKQREIESLQSENRKLALAGEETRRLLEEVHGDKEQLVAKLLEDEGRVDEIAAERVVAERERNRALQIQLEGLREKLEDNMRKYTELELEKNALSTEMDDLSNWKSIYEKGHGLQDLANSLKALKDDKRRLGVALEQMKAKMSQYLDAMSIYQHAFERLKKETGKPSDFTYDEYELEQDMFSEMSKLRAQLLETEEQIGDLELENTRLRKTLKGQAGSIGEQGFKFYQMDPEMLLKVNEFAENLRNGRITLPMDDRKQELLVENRKLKDRVDTLNRKLELFEIEFAGALRGGGSGSGGGGGDGGDAADVSRLSERLNQAEIFGLREDVQRLLLENRGLQDRMLSMQREVHEMLHAQLAAIGEGQQANSNKFTPDGIAAVLLANNDALLRELEELKAKMAVGAGQNLPGAAFGDNFQNGIPVDEYPGEVERPRTSGQGHIAAGWLRAYGSGQRLPPTGRRNVGTPMGKGSSGDSMMFTPRGGATPMIGGHTVLMGNTTAMMNGPATPHGKLLLSKTLAQLNLPPEEWAQEVRDLNAQLVECLEQLFGREQELEEHQATVSALEDTLIVIKQQMATLYQDYSVKSDDWDSREKLFKQENTELRYERDDLKLQIKRFQEVSDAIAHSNEDELQTQLVKLSRRVIGYEVKEVVANRKATTQSELLQQEQLAVQRLEADFAEMESTLKKRILYLEQYKTEVGSRLGRLQGRLDTSVPAEDFRAIQSELECLREDHLTTLRREVEARVTALKSLEQANELRVLRMQAADLQANLHGATSATQAMTQQLEHQKEATQRALVAANTTSELSSFVSEMARFRGEASRLEVELLASNKRSELLHEQLKIFSLEAEATSSRVKELEAREESASAAESDARRQAADIELKYEGGLTGGEASELRQRADKLAKDLEKSEAESHKFRELSEIAALQAQTLGAFRQQHVDELNDLREYCTRLESKGDDELLIGKLQRQLMSTKTSYKAFVRKYQLIRGSLRQREMALRVLEVRLDDREKAVMTMQETHRMEIAALKKSLRNLQNIAIAADGPSATSTATENGAAAAAVAPGGDSIAAKKKRLHGAAKKLSALGRDGMTLVTVGEKLLAMSEKVNMFSSLAENAVSKASEAEEDSRKLHGQVEDLAAEKDILLQRCADLEHAARAATGKGTSNSKQQALAARLVALSEEVRAHKLAALQQRREIQVLRQEKRHLQSVVATMEADVEDLEEGKVIAETKHLLSDLSSGLNTSDLDGAQNLEGFGIDGYKKGRRNLLSFGDDDQDGNDDRGSNQQNNENIINVNNGEPAGKRQKKIVIHLDDDNAIDGIDAFTRKGDLSAEELMTKLQGLTDQLTHSRRETSEMKLRSDRLQAALVDHEAAVQEMKGQVQYYENVLAEEGLPSMIGRSHSSGAGRRGVRGQQQQMIQEDQERLQEAASATIGSLRQLLDEKNRQIEKLRERLEDAQSERKRKTPADRKADELLQRLDSDMERKYISVGGDEKGSRGDSVSDAMQKKLLDQIDQADQMLMDKDKVIAQLEQKLNAQSNQRERAEIRCGTALKEMEAMKGDMMVLAQQVQIAEEKYNSMVRNPRATTTSFVAKGGGGGPGESSAANVSVISAAVGPSATLLNQAQVDLKELKNLEREIQSLEKNGKAKDDKIKGYRDIIVKLKEEFIKTEEEKAVAMASIKSGKDKEKDKDQGMSADEMRELRSQISALRDGLKQAKEDLEKARQTREKLISARQAAQEQADRLESQVGRAEAQAAAAQESLARTRKELEETRKREVRLRDKLKEFLETESGSTKLKDLREAAVKMDQLEKDLEVLRAQNLALRRANADGAADRDAGKITSDPSRRDGDGRDTLSGLGAGRVLGAAGEGSDLPENVRDDVRQQLHLKWESEKKLQKRVAVLEKRLQEKIEETDDLTAQLKKARDTAQAALSAKDELTRRLEKGQAQTAASTKQESNRKNANKLTLDDVIGLEEAHERIFTLEEQISGLRKKAEVDLPNEIATLRHELSVARSREGELSSELEEMEMRLKRAGASSAGGRTLRDSEDRFMREERLKEDLERARRQRLDLEAALLDRDSRAMESKFDLEAKEQEAQRLGRRVKELENAYRHLSSTTGAAGALGGGLSGGARAPTAWGDDDTERGAGSRFKRERDLEGVVDTMKKVVEKLKAENERLRKGTGLDGRQAGESEKKASSEKKRADKFEEENKTLQAKLKTFEDSGQRLAQRQQQLVTMRKQLKAREDELAAMKEQLETAGAEKETLRRKAVAAEGRVQQLEVSVQQARAAGSNNKTTGGPSQAQQERGGSREKEQLESEISDLRKRAADHATEVTALREQLAAARSNAQGQSGASGRIGEGQPLAAANIELQRLRQENDKLRQELSAFDIDFFNEIEDLKYKYSEAVKKLRVYEGTGSASSSYAAAGGSRRG